MVQKIELKNIEEYLREIGKFPLLDQKTEKELQKEAGNAKENKQKLFNSNLRLVISVAKKFIGYGVELIELIKVGNEGLEKAIDDYNNFVMKRPDLSPSSYYTWQITHDIVKNIVDNKFPIFGDLIKKSLKENDFDNYYANFFLEQILINVILYKESGSKDALEIIENSIISTFSDTKLKNRVSDKNFIYGVLEFMEILKTAKPEIYEKLN